MASTIEKLTHDAIDIKKEQDDAIDTGREIARMKKQQSRHMEGLNAIEVKDNEAIRSAVEDIRNDALSDYKTRAIDVVDNASQKSDVVQSEGLDSESETRDQIRVVDDAASGEYGSEGINVAKGSLSDTAESFQDSVERLRAEEEAAERRIQEIRGEI